MIIEAAAGHTPATGDGSAPGIFGSQQSPTRGDDRVRRETLPDRRSYVITQHQPGIASVPARLRTRFVDHWTYQEPKDQLTRARAVRVQRMDDCVAAVEREHVGIGAVVENCLERAPTMFSDADDQHVVIIAQGSCERRNSRAVARRRSGQRRLQARCAISSRSGPQVRPST
jgi:hypothetical protein